jgi:hypothetical protein
MMAILPSTLTLHRSVPPLGDSCRVETFFPGGRKGASKSDFTATPQSELGSAYSRSAPFEQPPIVAAAMKAAASEAILMGVGENRGREHFNAAHLSGRGVSLFADD